MLLVFLDWLLLIRFVDLLKIKVKFFIYESTEVVVVNQNKPVILNKWSYIKSLNEIKANLDLGVKTFTLKSFSPI